MSLESKIYSLKSVFFSSLAFNINANFLNEEASIFKR